MSNSVRVYFRDGGAYVCAGVHVEDYYCFNYGDDPAGDIELLDDIAQAETMEEVLEILLNRENYKLAGFVSSIMRLELIKKRKDYCDLDYINY